MPEREDMNNNAMSEDDATKQKKPFGTGWANEPTVADLRKDYEGARTPHSAQTSQIKEYLDYLHVTGKAKKNIPKNRSQVQPKLIRKQAEWRYAALSEPFLSTDDVFNASPVTYEDKTSAYHNQLVLNHQFNNLLDKEKLIDEYIRTAVDEGTVILRVGWESDEEEVEEPIYAYKSDPSQSLLISDLMELQQNDPMTYERQPKHLKEAVQRSIMAGTVVVPVDSGQTRTRTKVIKNQPTVEVCDYRDVLIDPTCLGDMDKAQFVIYKYETTLSDLEKSGQFKNLEKINPDNHSPMSEVNYDIGRGDGSFKYDDKPRKKLIAYEYWGYWDIDDSGETKPIVATFIGNTMIRLEENPFPDRKLPFILVQYLPKRKQIYGEPDGALLQDNQDILGASIRGAVDIMARSANGQRGFRKDALDVINKRRFKTGEDYEYNPTQAHPADLFHQHKFEELPQSVFTMMQLQNDDAEGLTGVKAFSGGLSGNSLGATATGVRGTLDAASKRETGILRRLAKGIVELGFKISAMNGEFLSEKEFVRITNEQFIPVTRDSLVGRFDLKLSISTAEADNQKAEELAFMFQTMGNNADPGLTRMVLTDIAKLRKMPDLAKRISDYQPTPDPVQEQLQALEIQKLQLEVQEIQSKIQLNLAKAQESSQAGRLKGGQADKSNLDYVEQEAGVTQERDLQKQRAQAEGNMDLEVLKSALAPTDTPASN